MNQTIERTNKRTRAESRPDYRQQPASHSANLATKKRRFWVWAYAPWIP